MRRTIAVAATVLLALGAASPAVAADAPALDAAKKLTTARIDGRLAVLKAEGVAVRNAARLTDGYQSTLEAILDTSTKGLTELRAKVQTETTAEAVKVDAQHMVDDYRVYLLVSPQVRLTIAADVESAAVRTLENAYATLAAAIETAEKGGKDMSAAKAKLAEMRTHVDAATAGLVGVVDGLLAVKPGPAGEAIRAQVNAAKTKIKTARGDIRAAAAAAKATRDLLK